MADNGYITDEQARAAIAEPLVTQTRPLGSQAVDVDYFVEEVRRHALRASMAKRRFTTAALQVRSTLDTRLQNYAVNALRSGLVRYDRRHGWRGAVSNIDIDGRLERRARERRAISRASTPGGSPWCWVSMPTNRSEIGLDDGKRATDSVQRNYQWARSELQDAWLARRPHRRTRSSRSATSSMSNRSTPPAITVLRQVPEVNGAIVAMDPHTGRVLALSGGFSYASSQFDRAMQAEAAAGIVLQAVRLCGGARQRLHAGQQGATTRPSRSSRARGCRMWSPKNFDRQILRDRPRLRRGLELSRNVMTVRLAAQLGMDKIMPYPIRFGVYDKLPPYLSNALGA